MGQLVTICLNTLLELNSMITLNIKRFLVLLYVISQVMLTHFLKHTNLTLIDCKIFLFLIFLHVFSNLHAILPLLKSRLLNIFFRVWKIHRKQVCCRKTRLRKICLIGERQCTPKGQAQYVNVWGSVQNEGQILGVQNTAISPIRQSFLKRVFLQQTCLW